MDDIEFRIVPDAGGGGSPHPTIHPVVNGSLLAELAGCVEEPAARAEGHPALAGSYSGLFSVESVAWPSRHFLGEPVLQWFDDGDTVLLGCTCGEWGCWPLTARVTVGAATVRWSDFRTGHRDWDLGALGPFEFPRDRYEEALRRTAGAARAR